MLAQPRSSEQTVFTCVAPVRPGSLAALRTELELRQQSRIDHERLERAGLIHCARLVLLEPTRARSGHYFGPRLVLSTWFDGALSAHLDHLTRTVPDLLQTAFAHCDGFDGGGGGRFSAGRASPGSLARYAYAHAIRWQAAYNSARLRSVQQIRAEAALVTSLQERAQRLLLREPDQLFDDLLRDARSDASLAWAFTPAARFQLTAGEIARRWLGWLARTAPRWLLFFASLRALRRSEKAEHAANARAELPASAIPPGQAGRDSTSNAYNSISFILPGRVRQRALSLFLDLLHTVGAQRTDLSGITSMRFAHWCMLDHGTRLLFCSMYDGAWEAYMADFVHLAGWGLTGVWSNTEDYPDTDFLVLNGARHERGFRRFVREREVETSFWFRAYPGVAGENIQDNSAIRTGLGSELDTAARSIWLSLL
jgi:hypothetical protein